MDTTAKRPGQSATAVRDGLVGRTVDHRYLVQSRIARGGMATVYEALDIRLDRVVALKVMHPALAEDAEFVRRFQREAKSAARLSHPHVVSVYDQGDDDGLVYLAMEYVPGRTARDVLREHGRLSAEQALTILDPVLQALDAAHHAGFVHRDIKPENVLLGDDGAVKVADFGLARAISTSNSTATHGVLIGTVAYLSPEQVERGIADARSDVYGAGILLYEMVTGAVPYAGETPLAVAYQHVNAAVPVPSSIRPGIPPQLDALVNRATRRDPDERFASAADFLDAVRATRRQLPTPRPLSVDMTDTARTVVVALPTDEFAPRAAQNGGAPATPKPPRRRRRMSGGMISLLAVLLIAALIGGGAWYLGAGRQVAVPGVADLTVADATTKLAAAGLSLEVSSQQFSETVKPDRIINTDPPGVSEARSGSTIAVIVSKGPERYAVPSVTGQTLAQATQALADASLTVGATTTRYDETVVKGSVITTVPAPPKELRKNTAVALVISLGAKPRVVPQLRGQSQTAATAALAAQNLTVSTTTQAYDDSVPLGAVISSTPAAGAKVAKGSGVSLVISKGPSPVTMPDLYKYSQADAVAKLIALGLKSNINNPVGFTPFGKVIGQNPDAGTVIHRGDTVTIDVV